MYANALIALLISATEFAYLCVCVCVCVWLVLTLVKYQCENGCFQLFIVSYTAYDFSDLVILHVL